MAQMKINLQRSRAHFCVCAFANLEVCKWKQNFSAHMLFFKSIFGGWSLCNLLLLQFAILHEMCFNVASKAQLCGLVNATNVICVFTISVLWNIHKHTLSCVCIVLTTSLPKSRFLFQAKTSPKKRATTTAKVSPKHYGNIAACFFPRYKLRSNKAFGRFPSAIKANFARIVSLFNRMSPHEFLFPRLQRAQLLRLDIRYFSNLFGATLMLISTKIHWSERVKWLLWL